MHTTIFLRLKSGVDVKVKNNLLYLNITLILNTEFLH